MLNTTNRIIAKIWFTPAVRIRVWHKIATQIENRMSLEDAITRLKDQAKEEKSPLEEIYKHILIVLGHGRSFGEAIKGLAANEEVMLISSALDTGKLPEGLELAVKMLKASGVVKKSLMTTLATPVMLFFACIAMFVMIAVQVMPQLAMVSDPVTWKGSAYLLYVLCDFTVSNLGIFTGIMLVVGFILICFSFKRWTGIGRRYADRIVPWSIYRLTIGTTWLYTIATRMSAGHQLSQILMNMKKDSSPYLTEIVSEILRYSQLGRDLGQSLYECGMNFPSKEIVGDLRVYATMPGFQEHLMDIADTWLAEGVESVKTTCAKIAAVVYGLIFGQMALVALVAGTFQDQIHM